jgi:hypothetical protein
MFENDYTLVGKHATYLKYLVNDARLFERYIDVYMNGAIFGLLHNRTAERDKGSSDSANILAGVFANCRNDCVFLYRLVMLLDKETNLEAPERIDRAFRDDADEAEPEKLAANMEVFNSYVRGGIEEMYEQFIDGHGSNPDEYLERAMDVMEEFKDDISGSDFEDRLRSLI